MGSAIDIGRLIFLIIERILYFVYCPMSRVDPLLIINNLTPRITVNG
jgi:hypothetical protein